MRSILKQKTSLVFDTSIYQKKSQTLDFNQSPTRTEKSNEDGKNNRKRQKRIKRENVI